MLKADFFCGNKFYLYGNNSDETLSVFNLEKNKEEAKVDCKNEFLGIDYVCDFNSTCENDISYINLLLGSFKGTLIDCSYNTKSCSFIYNSIVQTNFNQRMNSVINFNNNESSLICSDEGYYYIV